MGKAKSNGANNWPASKVQLWPITSIIPYEQNPRTHPPDQIAALAQDMIEDGVTTAILVDEAGVIIAGHGRLLAAQANGFTQYPVAIARGWSEKKKRAVRLKDNQRGLQSGWDKVLMKTELEWLKLEGYDLPLLGFPETQLRGWDVAIGTEGEQAEVAPERPKKPVVRKGDLWILGAHRLLCGDATSESDVAICLDGAKPHLMVTDPPYGVEYDPNWRNEATRANGRPIGASALGKVENDDQADWRAAWALFKGDVGYIWHAGRRASETAIALKESGFFLRAQIIWRKNRTIIGRGDYHYNHEPCWYVVREKKTGHWNGGRNQGTVWDIAHDPNDTGHGTQKPIECMKRPIENNSRAGDFVYEPFAGSGTTIIACEMTGRKAFAIEIDPGYVQVCIERWQKFTGRLALLDGKTLDQISAARRRGVAKSAAAPKAKHRAAGTRPSAPPAEPARSPTASPD